MEKIIIDTTKKYGDFKPLNAVNNGPSYTRGSKDQLRSNFQTYKDARIPYARNHDAAFWDIYGGEHTVDITAVFPNFDADENDPDSYDFVLTDEYIEATLDAGTETFYRLGQKIEHCIKKYGILPPKDFHKWARICEHIIRHCNYGWAGGKHYGIQYFEIWNEPNLDADDAENKRTWGGTKAQFFDLYEITAKHLKSCFPELKIGGPSLAHNEIWAREFLEEMRKREVPIDFLSWHIYTEAPEEIIAKSVRMKEMMDANGYQNAESICNEWNYVRDWEENFVYSLKNIIGIKGASFTLACICAAQPSSIDMLMYYDARPMAMNGIFDCYTLEPLAGYYPLYWYAFFYDGYKEVRAVNQVPGIYTLCGVRDDGKRMMLCTCYNKDDDAKPTEVAFDLGKTGTYRIYLTDRNRKNELIATTGELQFTLNNFDCMRIEEI